MTETQVHPRVQVEFICLQYLVSFVCVCVCVCGCFSFCFSVSTGELKYGDVCDTFMHVKKAFSSFCHVRGRAVHFHPLSLCPKKAVTFLTSCCCLCEQGITRKEKASERIRWKCLRKKREKSEIIFYFFRTIIVKHRNLQCLFICFCVCFKRCHLFSPCPIF